MPDNRECVRTLSDREAANLELVRQVYADVLDPLDPDAADRYFAPGYIQHNPMARTGLEGLKEFLRWARTKSPDARHFLKRIFVDGDHVIAHVHVVIDPGTAGYAVIDIFRIEEGRVAEHWDVMQSVAEQSANANGMF